MRHLIFIGNGLTLAQTRKNFRNPLLNLENSLSNCSDESRRCESYYSSQDFIHSYFGNIKPSELQIDHLLDFCYWLITMDKSLTSMIKKIQRKIEYCFLQGLADAINNPINRSLHRKILQQLIHPKHRVSIVTFNYDLLIEDACDKLGLKWKYSVLDITKNKADLEIVKPHGSINWFYCPCPTCNEIYHIQETDIYALINGAYGVSGRKRNPDFWCKKDHVQLDLFFIPPTVERSPVESKALELWERCKKLLTEAEKITFIGYSMPDYDYHARNLIRLGIAQGAKLPEIDIVDRSKNTTNKIWDSLKGIAIKGKRYKSISNYLKESFL